VSHGYVTKKQLFETIMIWVSIRKVIDDTVGTRVFHKSPIEF